MKITVLYAISENGHFTGNEEILQTTMDYEDFLVWRNRREIYPMNSWKAED